MNEQKISKIMNFIDIVIKMKTIGPIQWAIGYQKVHLNSHKFKTIYLFKFRFLVSFNFRSILELSWQLK